MKKKIFVAVILSAFVSSILTVAAICLVLGIDGKSAINLGRLLSAMNFIEAEYVHEVEKDNLIDGQ